MSTDGYKNKSGDQIDSYTLKEVIGSGSYGYVWKVTDKNDNICAIKIMDNKSDSIKDVIKELWFLNELRDYGFTPIPIDIGVSNNKCNYIVMEYIEGYTLNEAYKKYDFTLDDIKSIVYQLLNALKVMESKHIIHRDLKPDNIMITTIDKYYKVTIVDGGMSTIEGKPHCKSFYKVTRWYRSPELIYYDYAKKGVQTCGIDVWSLGCILAELFAVAHNIKDYNQLFQCKNPMRQLQMILYNRGMMVVHNAIGQKWLHGLCRSSKKLDVSYLLAKRYGIDNNIDYMWLSEIIEGCLDVNVNQRTKASIILTQWEDMFNQVVC